MNSQSNIESKRVKHAARPASRSVDPAEPRFPESDREGAGGCYRAATILSRTRTNQADRRPLGFLIQQRVRFAWVVLVFLRIDEALRRLIFGSPRKYGLRNRPRISGG